MCRAVGTTRPARRSTRRGSRRSCGLDAFCEDDEVIARTLAEAGIRVFLFDHPWNREAQHPLITRVSGWSEVADRLASA